MLEKALKCAGCGEINETENYEIITTKYGQWSESVSVCPVCGEDIDNSDDVFKCAGCDNWFAENELEVIGNEYFCKNCRGEE